MKVGISFALSKGSRVVVVAGDKTVASRSSTKVTRAVTEPRKDQGDFLG